VTRAPTDHLIRLRPPQLRFYGDVLEGGHGLRVVTEWGVCAHDAANRITRRLRACDRLVGIVGPDAIQPYGEQARLLTGGAP
jgi:hypothetical protein